MTWECDRDVEMVTGFDTFIAADDEYLVSGGAEGINFDGIKFNMNIVDPLYYKKCSRFPVSGSITIELESGSTVYINYGDGECDDIAEMTVEDVVTEFTLGTSQQ